jgi:hypothetical protein
MVLRIVYWALGVLVLSCPPSHALPRFQFPGLPFQASNAETRQSILQWANSLSDAQFVAAAQNGQLGACTYADAVGPISSIAWGFMKVGNQRSLDNQLSMAGPKVTVSGTKKPISGIVYKSEKIRSLLKSNIKALYGDFNTDRDSQVAKALRTLINDADDPCKILTYSEKIAAQLVNFNQLAQNPANIVHKKRGTSIVPGECALRVNKVPVSNLSTYLDTAQTGGGCAYSLRKLPVRFCLYVFINNAPANTSANTGWTGYTGYRALADTKFDASVGLTNKINSINPSNLALLTHTVPLHVGVKALLDLNIEHSSITGWVDPRTQAYQTSCPTTPNFNAIRHCSFQGGTYSGISCAHHSDFNTITMLPESVRNILKLWYSHKDSIPSDASNTPMSNLTSSHRLKRMLDYYSAQTGNGDNNMLIISSADTLYDQKEAIDSQTLPRSAAVTARRMPLDRFPEIQSLELASGTTPVIKDQANQTLSITEVDCDGIDAGTVPQAIDRLSDAWAPFPVEPTSAGTTWAPAATSLAPWFATGTSNVPNCLQ